MIVLCEASSKFHRTMLPKRAFRAMLPTIFTKNARFATVSRDRHTESYEGSSGKIKMCVSLQRRAIQNFKMYVSLQRRGQKCKVLLQFWAIDTTFLARGFTASI